MAPSAITWPPELCQRRRAHACGDAFPRLPLCPITPFVSGGGTASRTGWLTRCSLGVMVALGVWALPPPPPVVAGGPRDDRAGKTADGRAYYRIPAYDAVNCLYIQLRLLGYTESYEAFRAKVPEAPRSLSLASLGDLGGKLGFRLVPVQMTMSELANAGTPVLVHFEEAGFGSGRFLLFLGTDRTGSTVALIDGSHVTRVEMSRDQFRRKWTGYALIQRASTPRRSWVRRGAAALVLAGLAVCLIRRARSPARRLRLRHRIPQVVGICNADGG
jgi:hypothetical protein